MNKVQDYIYSLMPSDAKSRRNGWSYFNCPCCYHTELSDNKHRGNIKFDGEGIVYNCFNCKMTWGWSPNSYMSKKMSTWLKDVGATPQDIMKIKALIDEYNGVELDSQIEVKKRIIRDIPSGYNNIKQSIKDGVMSKTLDKVYRYLQNRNPRLLEYYDLMWKDGEESFLIPCYEYGNVVGYSIRSLNDYSKTKYMHYIPSGYIFNIDSMNDDRKFEIVVEGQMDAISLNCISILSNVFTDDKLKRLLQYKQDKEIILVPDRDKAGQKMVEQLINEKYPFSVSFPNWEYGIKDVEEAVIKYGRLYTLYQIINSRISDKLKIQIESKRWFGNV